ncbi:MAG: hypothetical protein B7733_12085 [Myxococcales bacterium FL481]|nr:MAG: hypothetical protein B7733_12085 [Myxococcales bacterium FL481]
MLPVTHFLYLAWALWIGGLLWLAWGGTRRPAALVLWLFGSNSLLWLAFARYWGNGEGLVAAGLLTVVSVATVELGPRSFRWIARATAEVGFALALVCIALATVLLFGPAASGTAVDPYGLGGLRPKLLPVERADR